MSIKESEIKGNDGDSGQESEDTAELRGPGSTWHMGALRYGREWSQETGFWPR